MEAYAKLQNEISEFEDVRRIFKTQTDHQVDWLFSRLAALEAKQKLSTSFNWRAMAEARLNDVELLEARVRELTRQRDNAWHAIDEWRAKISELRDNCNLLRDQLAAASQGHKNQLTINDNLAAKVNRLKLVILDTLSVLNHNRQPLLTIDRIELAAKLVVAINADMDDK